MEIQWSLVIFTVLTGLGAWVFFFVGLNEFLAKAQNVAFPASVVALCAAAVGGIASVTHLSHPTRMLAALSHPTSGIFTEALLVGLFAAAVIVYIILLKRDADAKVRKIVAVIGMILGVALSFFAGFSYLMPSRPAWNSILLPLGYFATATVSGASIYLLLCAVKHEDASVISFAGLMTLITAIVACALTLAYTIWAGVIGSNLLVVLGGLVACGAIVPGISGYIASKKSENAIAMAGIAVCGAIIGSFAFRALMWLIGATGVTNYFGTII